MNSQDILCAVEVELCKKQVFLMLKNIILQSFVLNLDFTKIITFNKTRRILLHSWMCSIQENIS